MPELSPADWQAIEVTLRLCFYTTLILLVIATPIAWWLSSGQSAARIAVQAIVALPLVLPPTVLGFYLLIVLGPRGAVGGTLESLGLHHLAFTFEGILIASVLYSMPFLLLGLGNVALILGWGLEPLWAFLLLPPILFCTVLTYIVFSTDFLEGRAGVE